MRAELDGLVAWDDPNALRAWRPDDRERFGVEVQVVLAVGGTAITHAFDVGICSPRWFADRFTASSARHPDTRALRGIALFRRLAEGPAPYDHERPPDRGTPFPLTALLFAREWDHARLAATIRRLCERIEGRDGAEIAGHVARLLPWEYDYRYERAPSRTMRARQYRVAA